MLIINRTLRDNRKKNLNYHHLLTLHLFQMCMSFFLLLDMKKGILKNDGKQTIYFFYFFHMKVSGYRQLLGYQHSSKYLLLGLTEERNSYRFGTTWGWVNNDTILIFGWTIPLKHTYLVLRIFATLELLYSQKKKVQTRVVPFQNVQFSTFFHP